MNRGILTYSLLLIILLFCSTESICAQESSGKVNESFFKENQWKEVTKNADFTEKYKERQKKQRNIKPAKTNSPWKLPNSGSFFKFLILLIIFGVLVGLLYYIIKNLTSIFKERNQQTDIAFIVKDLDENMHTIDLDALLLKALDEKEYKLAVRILYIRLIKMLTDKNLIKWKKDKTSHEYVKEMFITEHAASFALLTSVYETCWFSDYAIERNVYQKVEQLFNKFLSHLN